MRNARIAASTLALLLVGCLGPAATRPPEASTTPTGASSASPSPTVNDPRAVPRAHVVHGSLMERDNAASVISALHEAAGGRPVLKLDVTSTEATLVVLERGRSVAGYRWADDVIDATTTDFQYFDQQTFDPAEYPLASIGRMFDVADLLEVRGQLVYQIQQYREGQVLQTVSSRPETTTVFFHRDASAVPKLGVVDPEDIRAGLSDVVGDDQSIHQFGFSPTKGYWAESSHGDEVVTRKRTGGIPMFETPSTLTDPPAAFDPAMIEPMAIAQALTRVRASREQECTVVIDQSLERAAPVMTLTCGDATHYADLQGRDMTELIGRR